jgi:hypothetical protein
VFVEEKGKARRRLVVAGQRTGLTAEIISGVKESERVVTYPDDAISDDTKIKPKK